MLTCVMRKSKEDQRKSSSLTLDDNTARAVRLSNARSCPRVGRSSCPNTTYLLSICVGILAVTLRKVLVRLWCATLGSFQLRRTRARHLRLMTQGVVGLGTPIALHVRVFRVAPTAYPND